MKILLIQTSPFLTHRAWNYLEHLGLGFLEKTLLNYGFRVDVFDATWDWNDVKTTASKVFSSNGPYRLLGFSVNRSNFTSTIETIRLVRKKGFKGHITLGGYFSTFHFAKILSNFPEIDSIVLGHGEYTLLRLCHSVLEGKFEEDIPGLAYRKDGKKVHFTYCHQNERFLSTVGIPVHRPRYGVARMITSRGCSWECTFCCVHSFDKYNFKLRYHRRNLDEVMEEVNILAKKYHVHHIWLGDMDFVGQDHAFIEDFCDELIRKGYNITFEGDCRADSLNESLIRKLSKAGFYCLFIGVESFIKRQVKDYNKFKKNMDRDEIFRTVSMLRKYGMIPRFGFIMFDKDSTLEELILNHDIISSTVGYGTLDGLANKLTVLPGTKLESEYLKDTINCFQVDINKRNCLKPYLYYTQYRFSNEKVGFVYKTSFSFRNKFHRLQQLFDNELRKGTCSYGQHASALWKLRDQFAPIYKKILSIARKNGQVSTITDDLRRRLDQILVNFCVKFGFEKKVVQSILEEENWNPGESHP